jgi:phosphate transport system substrate-binding protein
MLLPCLVILLASCGEPVATPEPIYLSVTGATEMAALGAELAVAFGAQQSTVDLEVSGPGTEYGLNALYAGKTDIAMASWLAPDPSNASDLKLDSQYRATAVARDGIAIIVHPSNQASGLGLLQLQDLFGGRIYDWQAVTALPSAGEVLVVTREAGSGTRAAFESLVMQDQRITPRAVVKPSPESVVDYVASHPQAIGYVSMGSVEPGVKVVRIEGEVPSPETATQGSYALSRELWLVTADPPPEGVAQFLDFVLSPAGQEIVARQFGRIR